MIPTNLERQRPFALQIRRCRSSDSALPNRAGCRIKVGVSPRLLPLLLLFLLARVPGWSQGPAASTPLRGESLVAELGCVQCHTDLGRPGGIREQAPDLSHAGLRYRPGYLFNFLLNPQPVRRHLGRARMPFFHLSEAEALALTLYLETLREPATSGAGRWPELPGSLRALESQPPKHLSQSEFERELADGMACLSCHSLQGRGGLLGPELENVAHQVQPAWVARYLVAPDQFGVPAGVMPAQFYRLSPDRSTYEPLRPDADRKIAAVLGYLSAAGATYGAELDAQLARAKQAQRSATPAAGEQLFRAFNCAACHRHPTAVPRLNAGPDLSGEGNRVQADWLAAYLKKPWAIRRSGFQPGDGGRMPDFRLRDDEVAALASYLGARQKPLLNLTTTSNAPLSAFAHAKAQALLESKLSCLGCHRLNGKGGVIGPDLSEVKSRLQPAYVRAMIAEPARVAPHASMPKLPLSPATIDLLARHLAPPRASLDNANSPTNHPPYLSPLEHPSLLAAANASPKISGIHSNYLRWCAPCHGPAGRGDGFNATFLQPVRPAVFNDRGTMSQRPDDTLFDGIHSGGAILNRSPWMPAWGGTLAPGEIRGLVRYLRELCSCEGPAWARDGKAGP